MLLFLVVSCLCLSVSAGRNHGAFEENSCFSRFDYEYKVVQKLVQLEERYGAIEKMVETRKVESAAALGRQAELEKVLQEQEQQIAKLESAAEAAAKTTSVLQQEILLRDRGSGSTYIRWGRTVCPQHDAELVYSGYAGGSYYGYTGSAATYLCLPKDPLWGDHNDKLDDYGLVYGAEYEKVNTVISGVNRNDDVPCAVCRSPRSSVLMIPARNECYGNWTLEYHGYLMSEYFNHKAASEYVCLDGQPESVSGGGADTNGKLFYQVEGRCGSLKCPPYVNGRELTCVVCSK